MMPDMPDRSKRIFDLEFLALLGSVLILSLAQQRGFHFYRSVEIWLFFAGMTGFYYLLKFRRMQDDATAVLKKLISSPAFVLTCSISLLLFWFLQSFPLKEWKSYILVDDYPVVYAFSKRGWDILRQGGYFGWDSSFVGGYFTATDMGLNLIHFLFPLSFFGWEIGFHLMLLLFFVGFPFLCFYYVRVCCKVDQKKALVSLLIASFFALHYFKKYLIEGMVAAFIGVDLVMLALIFFQRLKEGRRLSFFASVLTLTLLFYTHLGMFLYSIAFILIDVLVSANKKHLRPVLFLGCFLLITASPFLIYIAKYPDYFILDNKHFFPAAFSLNAYLDSTGETIASMLNFTLWQDKVRYYPLCFLPVLIYMFYKRTWRKQAIFTLFVILFNVLIPSELYLLQSRIVLLIPFLLSVLLSGFLITNWEKQNFSILLLGLFLSLILFRAVFINNPAAFRHGQPGDFYNIPLVEEIKTLDGRYIAVENNQHWYHPGEKVTPDFHWLPLLQLETHKLLFSNASEGHHHTPFRVNSFDSGCFGGEPIDKWEIEDVNKTLLKWGIKYLVVWNERTKQYFAGHPHFYEKAWQQKGDWVVFRFLNADTRDAVIEHGGEAKIADIDFYEKDILLSNCEKNSLVLLRTNYFPAWKAYFNNKEIPLANFNGQIGFRAPDSANYTVRLKYPRYAFLNILAAITLISSGLLSYKKIMP
jgi:hypothetical protein